MQDIELRDTVKKTIHVNTGHFCLPMTMVDVVMWLQDLKTDT